mmetsp:Transcript_36834/g.92349  ORF Transcript_36834/g.92349 Transcript_36834/m.92349 type:complete len:209 (+) Transcript_36834:1859-2485(+)
MASTYRPSSSLASRPSQPPSVWTSPISTRVCHRSTSAALYRPQGVAVVSVVGRSSSRRASRVLTRAAQASTGRSSLRLVPPHTHSGPHPAAHTPAPVPLHTHPLSRPTDPSLPHRRRVALHSRPLLVVRVLLVVVVLVVSRKAISVRRLTSRGRRPLCRTPCRPPPPPPLLSLPLPHHRNRRLSLPLHRLSLPLSLSPPPRPVGRVQV